MMNEEFENDAQESSTDLVESWKKTNGTIVGIFTLILICVFPLFFRNYYFDILQSKYMFYYGAVIILSVVMLIVSIVYLWSDGRYYEWMNVKRFYCNFTIKSIKAYDWAMLIFVAASIVSTIQSEYIYESFWGNEGRYMGLFLTLLYGLSYLWISRFLRFKQWYLDAFLISGMLACLIGILQYFRIDPVGFLTDVPVNLHASFVSTIGNINTYTSYVAMITGIGTVLFVIEKNKCRRMWYLFTIIVSMFALLTGISDNAYLALMVVYGILPLYLFNSLKGVKKYALLVSILLTEFWLIDILNHVFADRVLGIIGLFEIVAGYKYLMHLVVALWGLTVILYALDAAKEKNGIGQMEHNWGRWLWLGVVIAVVFGGCYVLYDVNIAGNVDRYGALKTYLLITDDWGTYRGFIWRMGMESYEKFPLIHKIFGYGPDTFGIITVYNYYEEMMIKLQGPVDSAHNEYLQYLVTTGVVGLMAYLSILFTSILEMLKSIKKAPALMAIVLALLCYAAQATVNISVPIVAPIMMTLLMVGISGVREMECEKKNTL